MSVAQFAFGPRLKAHRERQGITLQDIAESTKIAASLLSSLERNDVSQWPKGIYRRAFLRSYARAIDMPFEAVWAEFIQLFPEDGTAPTTSRFSDASQLRLTLAADAHRLPAPSTSNVTAAAVDLGMVLVVGLIVSLLPWMSVWMSLTLVSLIYAAASTVLVGGSLARWYLRTPRARRPIAASDHDLVIASERQTEASAPTMSDDKDGEVPVTVQQRPRIFAVTSARALASSEARPRRVADR